MPRAPLPRATSLFQTNLDFRQGGPFIRLAQLSRRGHRLAVTLRNIEINVTMMMWGERDVPRGTGIGVFYLRVFHHPNVRVTSDCVTQWLMMTFQGTLHPEQVRVTQIEQVEISEQDRARVENVFYPVILLFTEPLVQT
jgi:hypothetical protein